MVVTVARAEGLPGVTSSNVFRRPKNKQTQHRYVRVRVTDSREGRGQVSTAVTSSVAGGGSTCHWGEKGSTGESVYLRVDKEALDSFEISSLEGATEGMAIFQLEVWSEANEGGGEDVLLGRGQADATFVDSQPRWVVLDPKGKVEISIATGPHDSGGAEQVDEHRRKSFSTQDGQTLPLGIDREEKGGSNITQDTPEEVSSDITSKSSSPKWGLLRMPDLKGTLNASLGRAAKLRGKQREQTAATDTSEESMAPDSPADDVGQRADEVEDGGRERPVTSDNVPSDEHETQGKQANRVAIRGMQSIKESLQARLVGTSNGKLKAVRERAQGEEMEGAVELQEDDEALELPSTSRKSTISDRRNASFNMVMTHDGPGTSGARVQQDKSQKKKVSLGKEESGSPPEDGGITERGRSTHLRSLLQDASAHEQDVGQSEDDQDQSDADVGDLTARRDAVGEQTSEAVTKGPVAHVVSALDAISAKAAAASASRFKSTLSSPGLTSTLKGFGWSKTKEEPVVGGLSSPSDSSCDPEQASTSATPTGANEASEPAVTQQIESFDSSAPPLEATTLLVTVLKASGLPEVLAKSKFGWTKKNATQDPVVRLSVGDVFASSSVVQGGGRECRWGTKNEGDVVELSIPSSNVPAAGLEALQLTVEVFNKANDELGNDILLGRAEILVGDWLGKKAKWASLDAKRESKAGRVKLILALKDSENLCNVSTSSEYSERMAGNSCDAPDAKVDEADLTALHLTATSPSVADIGDTAVQQPEEVPHQGEAEANDLGAAAECDAEASKTAQAEESNVGVPPLALGSVSDENQQPAPLADSDSPQVSTSAVEKTLEAQRAEVENRNESVSSVNDNSLGSDAAKKEEGKGVAITILVIEADALHTRVPENEVGIPKSSPYTVLHLCGETRATSAITEGGAKCRWPGDGEGISFVTSHAALTAVGWGQEEAVGPYLTVEVYNQESPSREADVFVGSANIRLEEYLGFGPKWVDVHRRRKGRGRVLVDVKSPILQQGVPITGQNGSLDNIGSHADEEQSPKAVALHERREPSSFALEKSGTEGDNREETGANVGEETLSKLGSGQAGTDASTDLPRSTASNVSSTGSIKEVQQKQETTPSGADTDATGGADPVGSHIPELSRQQSQASALPTPRGDEGETEGSADKSATAEGAVARLVKNDEIETTPGGGDSNKGTPNALARRVAGGTSTALDLTAATRSSDQRTASITEEQPAEIGTVITAVGPRERLDIENPPSSRQERDSLFETVSVAHEENGSDQHHRAEPRGSSDLHAGGAPVVGTGDKTSNGCPERPNEVTAEAPDTQPREGVTRRVDPQRIKRAREIIRRRRTMVSSMGHASPGLRVAGGVGTTTAEKVQAATTIQGAFRGRIARRRLRVCQRAVIKIQAAYRGHIERKEFSALSARSKRAKVEEQRARARRSRVALTTQVNTSRRVGRFPRHIFSFVEAPVPA